MLVLEGVRGIVGLRDWETASKITRAVTLLKLGGCWPNGGGVVRRFFLIRSNLLSNGFSLNVAKPGTRFLLNLLSCPWGITT